MRTKIRARACESRSPLNQRTKVAVWRTSIISGVYPMGYEWSRSCQGRRMPPSSVAPGAVVATADEHHAERLGAGDLVQVALEVLAPRVRVARSPSRR
jgi:hypothetical protein